MSVLSIEGEQEQLDTEVRHEAFRARKKFLIDAIHDIIDGNREPNLRPARYMDTLDVDDSSIDWTPAENEKNERV